MVVTKDFVLPTDEELTTQEVNVSWPYYRAAAVFVGKKCEWFNNEFMLCREELQDPRKCLKEGKDVTKCTLEGLRDIKKHCRQEFESYVNCTLDTSTKLFDDRCTKYREQFDECMLKKLNIERPPFGYFCEAKVHNTARPKPPKEEMQFPNSNPKQPEPPYLPPKHGMRGAFT